MNRALQLLHGFVVMVRNRNYMSATPLFRLQLDNALRMWAACKVGSFDVFTSEVLEGKRIDKMKSKSGERLTDLYLVDSLAEHFRLPKLSKAYNHASGFIHLSGQHLFATHQIKHEGTISGRIVRWDDTIDDAKWLDLIKGFSEATDLTLTLVRAWANQKDEERRRRERV